MFDRVEAFYRPASVAEALRLLQKSKGQARVVSGGADGVVDSNRSARFLIDLTHAGLTYIRRRETACVIGATTTLAELEESTVIRALAGGLLSSAAAACGSVQIRNVATVGGNLANGSPGADLATALVALDASVIVASAEGRRRMPVPQYLARSRASKDVNSFVVAIAIVEPAHALRSGWSFQKFGRTEMDIAIVNAATGLHLDARGRVKWARIALGGVAPEPLRAFPAEHLMTGREFDHTVLAEVGEEVMREVQPISDVRATADFRRELSRVLIGRALEECAVQAGCSL